MSERLLLEIHRDTLEPHYPGNPGAAYTYDELVSQGCLTLADRLQDGSARIISGRWDTSMGRGFFEVVWVVDDE